MNIRDLVDLGDSIRAVIVDNHRPIHHSYNNENDKMACVVISKDDYISKDEVPESDELHSHLGAPPPHRCLTAQDARQQHASPA
jgi:hypothetical protein